MKALENISDPGLTRPVDRGARVSWCALASIVVLTAAAVSPRLTAWGASTWASAGSMNLPRSSFTATLLRGGDVLVAGGITQSGAQTSITSSAEIYNPRTNTWMYTSPMSSPRADQTATALPDGRVLVAGGTDGANYLTSAEIFDQASGLWSNAGNMTVGRSAHTATLLYNDRVLVVGGHNGSGPLAGSDIYDPSSNSWSASDSLRTARSGHTATLLLDGDVLVTGGLGLTGALTSVELYDPSTARWVGALPRPRLEIARYDHTATLLPDGRVLVAGGFDRSNALSSGELYNPASGYWTDAQSMASARGLQTATGLYNGSVLVTGGIDSSGGSSTPLNSAEIFDPATDGWTQVASMSTLRADHAAVQLADGRVLVAGGDGLSSAELYTPANNPTPTRTPAQQTTPAPIHTPSPIPNPRSPPPPPQLPATSVATPTLVYTLMPAPTPSPGAPGFGFQVKAIRIEPAGSGPDWKLAHPSLSSVPAGKRTQISLYVTFSGHTGTIHLAIAVRVMRNGHSVFTSGLNEKRVDSGRLWDHWDFIPRRSGIFQVTGVVSVNGRIEQASTSIIAHPVRRTVNFSFVRLQSFDSHGRPAMVFSRTQRVFLVATLLVKGASGSLQATVSQRLEYAGTHGWVALGRPVQNGFEVTNGVHAYSVSFTPQTPFDRLRMVLEITIGDQTKRRAATFTVRG